MAMQDPRTGTTAAAAQPDAVIYKPARGVMQAGTRLTHQWALEFAPRERERLDPLMGWPGSGDTRQQVMLHFPTRQAAENYAKRHGLSYVVEASHADPIRPKAYADNFRVDRIGLWSH